MTTNQNTVELSAPANPGRRHAWLAVVLTVIGAVIALASIGNGAYAAMLDSTGRTSTEQLSVAEVKSIVIEVEQTGLDVTVGSGTEAKLTQNVRGFDESAAVGMTLKGTELHVSVHGVPSVQFGDENVQAATLELPATLLAEHPALSVMVTEGALNLQGSYGAVTAELKSGMLRMTGSAQSVAAAIQSGLAELSYDVQDTFDVSVQEGLVTVTEEGATAPTAMSFDVSSGMLDVTVPDVAYKTDVEVSSGAQDVTVERDDASKNALTVNADSGAVSVRHR